MYFSTVCFFKKLFLFENVRFPKNYINLLRICTLHMKKNKGTRTRELDWGTSTIYRDLTGKTIDSLETNTIINVRARGVPLNQIKPILFQVTAELRVFFFGLDWTWYETI